MGTEAYKLRRFSRQRLGVGGSTGDRRVGVPTVLRGILTQEHPRGQEILAGTKEAAKMAASK